MVSRWLTMAANDDEVEMTKKIEMPDDELTNETTDDDDESGLPPEMPGLVDDAHDRSPYGGQLA
jgi:hypothetical protein